ncbi:MAPEG family protein [Robiginitomaculum antarcticum]|uniref:MAPEG family protein n=1 Tax=Robiginitomaculum antarcticum TaxID=437507 RepID=UPI0009FF7C97|nr:MAPEG family protein [Robiginitomaculum antarcticum]
MANTSSDKIKVLKGIFTAWILSAAFIGFGFWLSFSQDWFSTYSLYQVIAITLIPPSFSLVAGIAWAARTRHFEQNIDGSAPINGTPLDITLRYIRNTTEQVIIFTLASICLAASAPKEAASILPILGGWFLIARVLFWIGYKKSPLFRAIGFASTFHPTVIMLIVATLIILFNP